MSLNLTNEPASFIRGATCLAKNHREDCVCDPPLKGDGHLFCELPREPIEYEECQG